MGRTLPLGHRNFGTCQFATMALMTPLTVPAFSGQDARESVVDVIENLFVYSTGSGFSESGVLRRVLPVALPGAAKRWRRIQPPFQSWNHFVTALREEFLPLAYDYRMWRELDPRTQHPEEGLRDCVRAMQELLRQADLTASQTVKRFARYAALPPPFPATPVGSLFFIPERVCSLCSANCRPIYSARTHFRRGGR